MIPPSGRSDAGAFLARLVRLDPGALVRLRPVRSGVAGMAGKAGAKGPAGAAGVAELWAMLPFGVLVVRRVPARVEADSTVEAAALLNTLSDDFPPTVRRRDEAWRWGLPPARTQVVERIPTADVLAIAGAASRTLRAAVTEGVGGRPVGERVLRDALLDHVAIVVIGSDDQRIEVPQRLVQALVRMGFVQSIDDLVTESESSVTVRFGAGWVGLDGSYGSAWYRPSSSLRFG